MHVIPDAALLAALKNDDRQAFRQLTERYLDKVWRLAYRVVRHRQDAEDIAQEVFVTVWNNRHQWQDEGASFSTWIYRVTVNRSIDWARKRKQPHHELSEELADTDTLSGEDHAAQRQHQELMLACLKELPEKQMLSLLYYYYEEMDIPQICIKLQTTEDAVRSLLKRGRATMKEIIRGKLGDDDRQITGTDPYLR
jgi:RNA polymerase sigma-70 factor (ECF subfamily)